MKIALDAMGGDFGPDPLIAGADQAFHQFGTLPVLVGNRDLLTDRIRDLSLTAPFEIVDSRDVISMMEKASDVRKRRGSTVWMSTELLKKGEVDGVVSAGHSGASLASAMWVLGRTEGVERPAIGTILPSLEGHFILVDGGANVDCKPSHLVCFAHMGRVLARHLFDLESPKVCVLSNGEEETKGNELVQKTIELLKEAASSWFHGPVESRDIFSGVADVVVCDGFVGNVVLKEAEGLAQVIMTMMKEAAGESLRSRVGGLLLKPALSRMKKRLDYAEYGGAPLLGVDGLFVICHGRSNSLAISSAMGMADRLARSGLTRMIADDLSGTVR
jgi:glycerol-3-phosphate acyltransferase PlsX